MNSELSGIVAFDQSVRERHVIRACCDVITVPDVMGARLFCHLLALKTCRRYTYCPYLDRLVRSHV